MVSPRPPAALVGGHHGPAKRVQVSAGSECQRGAVAYNAAVTYRRIETPVDLPPEGDVDARSREKSDIDFKQYAHPGKGWEHSKDVAAFANALGGVLVVGADIETDPTKLVYTGLGGQTAAEVVRIYQHAAGLCSPPLTVDTVRIITAAGAELVAVNVDPFVDQLVASKGGHRETLLPHLWRYPIRRGDKTDDVAPEDLAMYMNRKSRSAFIHLSQIPVDKRAVVRFFFAKRDGNGTPQTASVELGIEVPSVEHNYVTVKNLNTQARLPLKDIRDVWQDLDMWVIEVTGLLRLRQRERGGPQHVEYEPNF
jgi:hypothetical protein